jgi:hypothetical protein
LTVHRRSDAVAYHFDRSPHWVRIEMCETGGGGRLRMTEQLPGDQ